jgi:tetratricopeptide (TPR) repeat protein
VTVPFLFLGVTLKFFIFFGILAFGLSTLGFAQTFNQYLTAGNQFYAAKDYEKAITYYRVAGQNNPNSAAAYQGLGNCYYLLGRDAEALEAYEKDLGLRPDNPAVAQVIARLKAKLVSSVSLPSQIGRAHV